jgi:hypothetical protein
MYKLIENGQIEKDRLKPNLYYLYIKDAIQYLKTNNI